MPDHSLDFAANLGPAILVDCPHCGTRILPLPGQYCPACRRDLEAPPDRDVVIESDEVQLASQKLARRLFKGGMSVEEVVGNLLDRGIHAETAQAVATNALRAQVKVEQSDGQRHIRHGFWCCAIGIAVWVLLATTVGIMTPDRMAAPLLAVLIGLGQIMMGLNCLRRLR